MTIKKLYIAFILCQIGLWLNATPWMLMNEGDFISYSYYTSNQSILVAKSDQGSELIDRPSLIATLNALPPGKKGQLMKDLGSITDATHRQALMDILNTKPKGIEAWSRIRLAIGNATNGGFTEFAIDPNTVDKVINLIEPTSNFRVAMGSNWEQELAEIITANKDLRCPTCSAGLTNIPPMDIMLENVEHISQFSTKPGFSSVLTALKSSSPNRDGINHMISYIKANTEGFATRRASGFANGVDLVSKINSGAVKIKKDNNGKVIGKIDIVSHSMGFAYAVGMVDAILEANILATDNKLGYFYALAPENACSAQGFDPNEFDEVWQYGTVEPVLGNPNPHKLVENDGVAPQCAVPGLNWDDDFYGRVRYGGDPKNLNFVDAHLGKNYFWVVERNEQFRGYVKKRN